MVNHSKSVQVLAYICGVILIPVYIFGPFALFYATYKSMGNPEMLVTVFIAVLSLALTYFGFKSLYLIIRFLKTLKVSFEFNAKGIVLNSSDCSNHYSWSDLESSKDYPSCQLFCLIDNKGNHLFSIWEYATNYLEFREVALEKIGI
ncbi:hypothetical protein [Colwellia sp. MB02u-14]|uniref:hypothetical protein n=1 Tax=Colwellia sp. MB02u-14 TaxID=2759815 RepID=UPI0015F443D6|nr:hypothetical protein [Colwellia sp. MB02u-14]MBA6303073.1 hypothetical protein [Colwellia sp. MB02u-14]